MSGIYIPDLPMPKSCSGCVFERWENGYGDYCVICPLPYEIANDQIDHREAGRMEWCPLTPVPDHGRLVDENDILNALEPAHREEKAAIAWKHIYANEKYLLSKVPTIIESDKEAGE